MNTRRFAKAAEAIRESVSTTILLGLRDPRVKHVTVLRAEVSGDLAFVAAYQQKLVAQGIPPDKQPAAAWAALARVLLTSNAFLYVD